MKKNKKGISPLVATVLLIGIVAVLAILVWLFLSGILKERPQKIGIEAEAKLICSNKVKVSGRFDRCITNDKGQNTAQFKMENKGSVKIDNIRLRFINSTDSSETYTLDDSLQVSQVKNTGAVYNISKPKKMEVIPIVNVKGVDKACLDQKVTLSLRNC